MDTNIIDLPSGTASNTPFLSHGDRPGMANSAGARAEQPPAPSRHSNLGTEPLSPDPFEPVVSADPADRLVPPGEMPAVAAVRSNRRRRRLLATACVGAVLVGGGWWLNSPYNTVYPIDTVRLRTKGQQIVDAVQHQAAALVAPAAQVANTSLPDRPASVRPAATAARSRDAERAEVFALRDSPQRPHPAQATAETGEVGTTQAERRAPPAPSMMVAAPKVEPPAQTQINVLGFETGAVSPRKPEADPANTSRSVAISSPPAGERDVAGYPTQAEQQSATSPTATAQPAAIPSAPSGSERSRQQATSPQSTPLPSAIPEPTNAVKATVPPPPIIPVAPPPEVKPPVEAIRRPEKPADPVAVHAALQAAPMSDPEQIQVLNEVARLAIIVRDMRAENLSLKARVESTADRVDQSVADFTRRLSLAEARGAINAAMGAEPPAISATPTSGNADKGQREQGASAGSGARPPASQGTRMVPVSTVVPGAAASTGAARYHVTAASPGLAMLVLIDRSGGEGSQIQVAVGDQVPGYGKVTAIQQRGASWIVQTDKGPDKGAIQ